MNEEFIIYLWQHKLFDFTKLTTNVTGEKVQLTHVGTRNLDSGPDFFNAKIKIGETLWAGNIEIHTKSSDWFKHNHHKDPAYDNIILHVVFTYDAPIYRKNGELIPTLELRGKFNPVIFERYTSFISNSNWIPCAKQLRKIPHFTQFAWLESLCVERLEEKAKRTEKELKQSHQDFKEIFYWQLCRNFGFNTNAHAFELLAKSLPLYVLNKHIDRLDQLEALIFGQAGLLSKTFSDAYPKSLQKEYTFLSKKYQLNPIDFKTWKFLRMRPSNFPTIRLSQFVSLLQSTSGLLPKLFEIHSLSDLKTIFKVKANEYWGKRSDFDKLTKSRSIRLGNSSIDIIFINTIIPFSFLYGKIFDKRDVQEKALSWYEEIKAEKNAITKEFLSLGLKIENAKYSQAAIHLKKIYCDKKRCLECRFGHALIHKSM